jgi:regulator of protease activity HflC (stomatin/prohibitin superfamily)
MKALVITLVVVVVVLVVGFALSARVVQQYQDGVLFRFGRVIGERKPGFRMIIPFVDVLHKISLRGSSRCRFSRRESSPRTT